MCEFKTILEAQEFFSGRCAAILKSIKKVEDDQTIYGHTAERKRLIESLNVTLALNEKLLAQANGTLVLQ